MPDPTDRKFQTTRTTIFAMPHRKYRLPSCRIFDKAFHLLEKLFSWHKLIHSHSKEA